MTIILQDRNNSHKHTRARIGKYVAKHVNDHKQAGNEISYMCKYITFSFSTVFSLMSVCCEVLARNRATKGIASQSSTRQHNYPQRAIDGNDDDNNKHDSCTLTYRQYKPWWKVSFEDTIHVYEVGILNSGNGKSLNDVVFPHYIPALATVRTTTCDTN